MKLDKCLFVIPARAGSKGLPGKNTKLLDGKALVSYSLEYALHFVKAEYICVTTDDDKVIELAEKLSIPVSFKRPQELASDTASANDVIKHAIGFFKEKGLDFNKVIYLQPTSPFRLYRHLEEALALYEREQPDMVVSVCESGLNPYFSLFEEDGNGNLKRSKELPLNVSRRQDVPKTYMYNGSIYIIRTESLLNGNLHELKSIKKYVMEETYAIDIDNETDWLYAQFLAQNKHINYD
ncbi:CMP-N-acetylneuraminic acid synthetase [Sphingobacteriaceae bacterium]|nr:CMP-N-acetylneuraminic acid synthetase [Sphingobacteriaceae bacterium]